MKITSQMAARANRAPRLGWTRHEAETLLRGMAYDWEAGSSDLIDLDVLFDKMIVEKWDGFYASVPRKDFFQTLASCHA